MSDLFAGREWGHNNDDDDTEKEEGRKEERKIERGRK